ncbi:hypothetical protein NQ166_04970 [Microbacterium sp. zg.Y1090]|uniref:hypothetical protein n=1 Tax=Microbacterium TaxID=33882 RepID=UPI00214AD735|nr:MULTISPECIES: hypothetical protein [unclassified Microbacterium]MCR2813479.1 hypothetical protein [Microbacterium sp. zg.Y1084]MCR2818185.1 hypothetical protein [Microbacterium sp. zg.Y1090]MDL5486706.1 hypothetical protein [Microbacterium sp. zg-Y1211]WIM27664.1 hypothetical protein QNO26_10945 [Microbacterium sp. zg-Y1090]
MTTPRSSVSSTPVLRATLLWSAGVTAVLAVIGAVAGYAAGGTEGLWSALCGVGLAFAFLGITGVSILVANRWYGDALYVPIFFGIVLGGWILKFLVFIVLLLVLRDAAWLNPTVFFLSLVAGIVASLVIDVVVLTRMRVPHASDVTLPTADEVAEQGEGPEGRH